MTPGPLHHHTAEQATATLRSAHRSAVQNEEPYAVVGRRFGVQETQARAMHCAFYRLVQGRSWDDAAECSGYPTRAAAMMAVRRLFATPDGRPALPRWAK